MAPVNDETRRKMIYVLLISYGGGLAITALIVSLLNGLWVTAIGCGVLGLALAPFVYWSTREVRRIPDQMHKYPIVVLPNSPHRADILVGDTEKHILMVDIGRRQSVRVVLDDIETGKLELGKGRAESVLTMKTGAVEVHNVEIRGGSGTGLGGVRIVVDEEVEHWLD